MHCRGPNAGWRRRSVVIKPIRENLTLDRVIGQPSRELLFAGRVYPSATASSKSALHESIRPGMCNLRAPEPCKFVRRRQPQWKRVAWVRDRQGI